MRSTIRMTALLALASHLFAGGFFLQLGNPEASKEAVKLGAVLTVKATGCHDPATAKLSATAIGVVNGVRREIPLTVIPMSEAGTFAISQEWPKQGTWVINLAAHNDGGQFTNTLVGAGVNGIDRAHAKFNMQQFTPAEIDAMLR